MSMTNIFRAISFLGAHGTEASVTDKSDQKLTGDEKVKSHMYAYIFMRVINKRIVHLSICGIKIKGKKNPDSV